MPLNVPATAAAPATEAGVIAVMAKRGRDPTRYDCVSWSCRVWSPST
jgi:hypothetical protein